MLKGNNLKRKYEQNLAPEEVKISFILLYFLSLEKEKFYSQEDFALAFSSVLGSDIKITISNVISFLFTNNYININGKKRFFYEQESNSSGIITITELGKIVLKSKEEVIENYLKDLGFDVNNDTNQDLASKFITELLVILDTDKNDHSDADEEPIDEGAITAMSPTILSFSEIPIEVPREIPRILDQSEAAKKTASMHFVNVDEDLMNVLAGIESPLMSMSESQLLEFFNISQPMANTAPNFTENTATTISPVETNATETVTQITTSTIPLEAPGAKNLSVTLVSCLQTLDDEDRQFVMDFMKKDKAHRYEPYYIKKFAVNKKGSPHKSPYNDYFENSEISLYCKIINEKRHFGLNLKSAIEKKVRVRFVKNINYRVMKPIASDLLEKGISCQSEYANMQCCVFKATWDGIIGFDLPHSELFTKGMYYLTISNMFRLFYQLGIGTYFKKLPGKTMVKHTRKEFPYKEMCNEYLRVKTKIEKEAKKRVLKRIFDNTPALTVDYSSLVLTCNEIYKIANSVAISNNAGLINDARQNNDSMDAVSTSSCTFPISLDQDTTATNDNGPSLQEDSYNEHSNTVAQKNFSNGKSFTSNPVPGNKNNFYYTRNNQEIGVCASTSIDEIISNSVNRGHDFHI